MSAPGLPFAHPVQGRLTIRDDVPGFAVEFRYENGWGASIVRNAISPGNRQGLFSLATIDPNSGELVGCRAILGEAGEPLGWLTPDEVDELLTRIVNLPPR